MAEVHTHIVYRNRVEHDFYESGMAIPLIGALACGALVFIMLCKVFGGYLNKWSRDRSGSNILLGALTLVSVGAGITTFRYLMF